MSRRRKTLFLSTASDPNGTPVTDMTDLISYLVSDTDPGDVVTLDIIQADGTTAQVEVELGVRPSLGN